MVRGPLPITPQTKIGELLEAYPDLEAVLVAVAPAFKKLRNPMLRRTVARVTSVAQAARVGGVPVAELVRRLRIEVGQEIKAVAPRATPEESAKERPGWFDIQQVVERLDARPLIEAGEQPLARVLQGLEKLCAGQIYELVTPFEPAPLIDTAKSKGFTTWTTLSATEYRTYFVRSAE
jgi:hypothetical protein